MAYKKISLILFIFIFSFLLVGCKTESNEIKLCKDIIPKLDDFSDGKITYDELSNSLKSNYDEYCPDEENSICERISSKRLEMHASKPPEDCSKYEIGSSDRVVCEATYELKKETYEKSGSAQKGAMSG